MCALSVKISGLLPYSSKIISLEMFTTDLLSFHKEIQASSSVSTVKLSLKDRLLNVFKLLESYFFLLGLEAIIIAAKHLSCVSHQ